VGWQLEGRMQEQLVIASLNKALQSRGVKPGLIVHSDRGGQYAGCAFRKVLMKRKISQSMSRADDPYDNAAMESFFSRLKAELLQGGIFDNLEDGRNNETKRAKEQSSTKPDKVVHASNGIDDDSAFTESDLKEDTVALFTKGDVAPLTATVSVEIHSISGYGSDEAFARATADTLEKIINAPGFKKAVLGSSFSHNQGLTSGQIYDKIMNAHEEDGPGDRTRF
jgi:transposase InsO family protein